jgi:hypothetical protein
MRARVAPKGWPRNHVRYLGALTRQWLGVAGDAHVMLEVVGQADL